MRDLAAHLWYRKLTDIVIPGSHDTATYGLDGLDWSYAGTQNKSETITDALNQGIREFDLRVVYKDWGGKIGAGYWARHSDFISDRLRLDEILDQIKDWTLAPGHEHEIVMFSLGIDDNSGQAPFPTATCKAFTDALGSALLTPKELMDRLGTADPGQVRLGQLWSMPGHPRVIMDEQCMDAGDPSAGRWSVDVFGDGYYANQCYADNYPSLLALPRPGITERVLKAAKSRLGDGGGGGWEGDPEEFGRPKVGGLYVLNIQATTTLDCGFPLWWFDRREDGYVLAALYQQWLSDPATRAHVNIISGDFVEDTDLVQDVIAMDESWPIEPDAIVALGFEQVSTEQDQDFGAPFAARATYQGNPAPGVQVTYRVSPDHGRNGPNFDGASTRTVTTDEGGDANVGLVHAGHEVGTFTLTASVPGGAQATWTLTVVRTSDVVLLSVAGNPTTVRVGQTLSDGFVVRAVDPDRQPVPGLSVEFDAMVGGTFPGGAKTATVTTDASGIARSPALTAGTLAGAGGISAHSYQVNTVWLPLTVAAGDAKEFIPLTGNLQTVPINTTFPVPLTGHYVDQYGNVITNFAGQPAHLEELGVDSTLATWPNGENNTTVTPAADGTITAPALRAGQTVLNGAWPAHVLLVYPGPFTPRRDGSSGGWILRVAPGPPNAITATGGDDQQTGKGQPFAHPLAAKVTDTAGNPIPGIPVKFEVTSGEATFPSLKLGLFARLTANPGLLRLPDHPRESVMVPSRADGVATSPVLTAGHTTGPIVVRASVDGAPAAGRVTFTLFAVGVPPSAPSITGVSNGDAQVSVSFSDAGEGTSPILSHEVSATDLTHPGTVTATGANSPIVVGGLINGDTYEFWVTATSADGTSPPSAPGVRLNVGVPPVVISGPAGGVVGKPYSSRFTVTGRPPPTFTQVSGDLPPGLTLDSDGALTGTPTRVGSYIFTVQATSPVGIYDATVPVTISPAALAAPAPKAGGEGVRATICANPPQSRTPTPSACAGRTLIGTFPPLSTGARAILARGSVVYAVGHAIARYRRLTLRGRRRIPAGRYTLSLRGAHHAIIVVITIPSR